MHELKAAFKPGPGELWSNLEDMAKWERNFFEHRVGSARLHRQMLRPATYKRRLAGDTDYAAGLELFRFKQKLCVGHDGMDIGAVTHYRRLPAQGFAVLLLSNREDPPAQLAWNILLKAAGQTALKIPKRRLPRAYRGWSGYYEEKQSRAFWRFSATAQGYRYHTGDPGPEIRLSADERFYAEGNRDISFQFCESPSGERSIEVRHRGKLRRGKLCFLHPFWLNEEKVELWALGPDKVATTGGLYMEIERNSKGTVNALDEYEPGGRYKHVRMIKAKGTVKR